MSCEEKLQIAIRFIKDCLDHEDSLLAAEAESTMEFLEDVQ